MASACLAGALTWLLCAAPAAWSAPASPPGSPAISSAPVTGDLQSQAAALTQQVNALQDAEEVAAEQADAANDALTAVVSAQIQAGARQDAAAAALRTSQAQAGARARAIQQTGGGRLGLVLPILQGDSPADVLDGYQAVSALIGSDHAAVRDARAQLAQADAQTATVLALRNRQLELTAQVDAALRAAQAALAAQQALLATTNAQVVALAQLEEQQRDAEATAQAWQAWRAWGGNPDAPAPSEAAEAAIAAARTRLGDAYVWGATGPDTFDCSGLTQWAYGQAGVQLPRTTKELYADLPHVSMDDLAPGDLVLFATDPTDPSTIHHVGLYIGEGLMIHAPHTGDVVRIAAVTRGDLIAAVRPSGAPAP